MRRGLGMASLLIPMMMMGGTAFTDGTGGGASFNPADVDTTKHGSQKQGEKTWVINGEHFRAVTKKSALKKAEKHFGAGFKLNSKPYIV